MQTKRITNNDVEEAKAILEQVCSEVTLVKTNTAIQILRDTKLDNESIASAYLYIPFTHSHITKEEIESKFSPEIYTMLVSLDKLHKIEYNNKEEEAENIRKMYFALTKDVRVIFIKLAFVLSEMKNLQLFSPDIQKQKAKVALDLFAPLAARLGASNIKSELEDLSFKFLHPVKYKEIQKKVDEKFKESAQIISNLKDYLNKILEELGIKGELMGRKKHIYSINKKLNSKADTIDEIYDLVALRVLVDDIPQCYAVLGRIHADLTPLPGRFKDYIAMPKSNGYQSLHTTIYYNNLPVEIQIRTNDMHRAAEFGYAAHWMYKEKRTKMDSLDTKLGWIREMIDESQAIPSEEVIETLKVDIYDGEIFVQSPLGKVVHLPEGASSIDFAYCIHSDVGNKMVGVKVNGKIQPITIPLKNGDIVEIITSPTSKGPSRDWLKIVKTFSAKNKIRAFFKREMKDENIKLGKSMLEATAKNNGFVLSQLLTKERTEKILEKQAMLDMTELYAAIGNGSVSANVVTNKLVLMHKQELKIQQKQLDLLTKRATDKKRDVKDVVVKGADNLMTKMATCCSPIPNDEIIGYISQGRGIIVHRRECHNVKFYSPERLIEVEWANNTKNDFEATMLVKVKNKTSVLTHLSQVLVDNKIALISLCVDKLSPEEDGIKICVGVKNNSELDALIKKIYSLDNVNDVYRI